MSQRLVLAYNIVLGKLIMRCHMVSGSVYYHILSGSHWSHQSKILANDASTYCYFGSAISIYNNNALIGAEYDSYSGIYSYFIV
jgi:hypothetical protein